MSHQSRSALFFILASFAIVGAVSAQEPSADDTAKVQSGPQAQPQAQPQTAETPKAQTSSPSDQSATPTSDQSPTPTVPPPKSDGQPAANKGQPLATIVVNGGPSADILRSARNAGFNVKIAGGTTHFCKTEAPIGTRFVTEHCMNEQQVTLFLERAQDQREKLSHVLGAPAVTH